MSDDLPVSFGREFPPEPEGPSAPPESPEPPPPHERSEERPPPGGGPSGGRPPGGPGLSPPPSPTRRWPTTWPGVLGVLGIIFGTLGSIGNLSVFAWPVFRPWMLDRIAEEVSRREWALIRDFIPGNGFILGSGIIELGLAVLLLIAGIHLLQRRQSGARLIKLWAIISIPWALVESGLGVTFTRDLVPRLRDFGVRVQDFPIEFFTSMGIGIGLLFSLAVPIFILAWFGSQKIRTEVEGWRV